ncbi:MAG: hypothetical protein HY840_06790 [Bacteroidetes bacterium]|nr:hypothetical protein [Bacteroidota bacterium]
MKKLKEMTKAVGKVLIILATMPKTVITKVIAVLNMRKVQTMGAFIAKAKLIRQSMKANISIWFPNAPVALADNGVFDTDIKALDTAQTAADTRVKGAAQTRNDKKAVVLNDLHLLLAYVQTIADANPKNAETIVISSGFDVKHLGTHGKEAISVKPKKGESGTMIATVKKVEGAIANLWEYSTDEGKTWIDMDASSKGKTEITGLTPGSKLIVRNRPVLRKGKGTWIQSAIVIVV